MAVFTKEDDGTIRKAFWKGIQHKHYFLDKRQRKIYCCVRHSDIIVKKDDLICIFQKKLEEYEYEQGYLNEEAGGKTVLLLSIISKTYTKY